MIEGTGYSAIFGIGTCWEIQDAMYEYRKVPSILDYLHISSYICVVVGCVTNYKLCSKFSRLN